MRTLCRSTVTRVPARWRNGWWSNLLMVLCAAAFVWLAATEIQKAIS